MGGCNGRPLYYGEVYMDNDILKFLQEKGIINLDDVREEMEQDRRRNILAKHKYSIFQDKDGRWKTTIDDPDKKNGKRLVARKDRRDLEDYIIDYLEEEKTNDCTGQTVTLRSLYVPWLKSRVLEANSIGTVKKNDQDWKKYYENDPIVDRKLGSFTHQELKDWAHQKIRENNFTKKDYYNMIVIMNKIWQYAWDCGKIERNTWRDVKINTKLLRKNVKKSNETQVFFFEEKMKLCSYCLSAFNKNPKNISALTIPLMFLTGMRIGELVALKYEDCIGDEILIRRAEVVDYDLWEDGSFHYIGVKVADHTKTDAGERSIPFTRGAKQIINLVKEASEEFGFYDDGYIFCPNSSRIRANRIDIILYDYCEKVGIPKKSAHKIRKTFISQMIICGIDFDTICRVAGHTDFNTTFNSYTYSLTKKEDRLEEFQNMCSDLEDVIGT